MRARDGDNVNSVSISSFRYTLRYSGLGWWACTGRVAPHLEPAEVNRDVDVLLSSGRCPTCRGVAVDNRARTRLCGARRGVANPVDAGLTQQK